MYRCGRLRPRPGPLLRQEFPLLVDPAPTLTLGTDYFSCDRYNNDFTLAPASMHGATAGDPMYFVEENTYESGSQMRVVSATDLLEQFAELHRYGGPGRDVHRSAPARSSPAARSRPTIRGSSTRTTATACWSPTRTSAWPPTATRTPAGTS